MTETICECFSCDHQCGGTANPNSCGPLEEVAGRMLCQACCESAQVVDREREGASVFFESGDIVLTVGVWDTFGKKRMRLNAIEARELAALLENLADAND